MIFQNHKKLRENCQKISSSIDDLKDIICEEIDVEEDEEETDRVNQKEEDRKLVDVRAEDAA